MDGVSLLDMTTCLCHDEYYNLVPRKIYHCWSSQTFTCFRIISAYFFLDLWFHITQSKKKKIDPSQQTWIKGKCFRFNNKICVLWLNKRKFNFGHYLIHPGMKKITGVNNSNKDFHQIQHLWSIILIIPPYLSSDPMV